MAKSNNVKVKIRGEFEIEKDKQVIVREFSINTHDYKRDLKELSENIEELIKGV